MADLTETPDIGDVLPSREGSKREAVVWLPWVIIGVATVILVLGNIWGNQLKNEGTAGSDLDQLAILKFQPVQV